MFTKFKENLKMIDIFGQQITLSFRQEEQYRTSFGGFLSLCIIGIIVSFFYSNIIDFFEKNTVTTATQTNFNQNPDQMTFPLSDFMFAVQVEQDNFTTNPYFNITLEQKLYTRDENGTQTKLPGTKIDLIPCTIDHFKPIFDKYNASVEGVYNQYKIGNFLCPNLSHPYSQNLTASGGYFSSNYYFLKFSITSCKNTSSSNQYLSWKPICKSQEAIDKIINSTGSFRFQVYTTNFVNFRIYVIELANDLYEFDLNKKGEDTKTRIHKLLSQSQHGREKLKKSIKEVPPNINTVISTFNQKPIVDTPNIEMKESYFVKPNLPRQISKKKVCQTKIQNSKIFEQFKDFMKKKRYIGISIRLIISQILPFDFLKSDECIVIKKAIDQVNKEFDIQFMMKQLHELIKLKKVLFNDEQIELFNFSQKPKISLYFDKRRKSGNRKSTIIQSITDVSAQDMALQELFISLVSSYQKIIGLESNDMTEEQLRFNTRLITLLGGKLPGMIEKELDMASDDSNSDAKHDEIMSS